MRKMPKNRAFGENIWGEGLEKGEILPLFSEKFALEAEFYGKFMQNFGEFKGKFAKKVLCHYRTWKQYER